MELNSSINRTWKLCFIGSLFGCLILLLFLHQNYQNVSFSAARNTVLEFAPFDNAEAPIPAAMIFEPPKPSAKALNFTSNLNEKRAVTTLTNHITLNEFQNPANKNVSKKCNMFDGRWVYKQDKNPSYDTNSCPFIEEKMSCRKKGRPDFKYENWRWKANECGIPSFNGRNMLERLRNKKVVIVGHSLNGNMWESLSCLLYSSLPYCRAEVHAESPLYKVLKAKDYNTTIEFHWSPFLVVFDEKHNGGKKVLILEKLSPNSKQWKGADVMVFNSGHWWNHTEKFEVWDLVQYKGQLFEEIPVELAYLRGMKTRANWIDENVDPKKTSLFFRSISAQQNGNPWCYNSTKPIKDESYTNNFPNSLINTIENTINRITKLQVKYLNITKLTEYRIDVHPSVYRSRGANRDEQHASNLNSTWSKLGQNLTRVGSTRTRIYSRP